MSKLHKKRFQGGVPPWVKFSEYGGTYKVGKPQVKEPDSSESFTLPSDENGSDPAQEYLGDFSVERDPESTDVKYTERATTLSGLPSNFTKEDFQQQRTKSTITEAIGCLNQFSTDITETDMNKFTGSLDKVCLICCNHYNKPRYALGSGPINDSATVADNHQRRGYHVYYMLNPTPERFVDLVSFFLQNTKVALTIFYTGHGAQVKDSNGDEDDHYDEAMVFDSGHIVDDDLLVLLKEFSTTEIPILLLTDCCHSGSIWDLQSEENRRELPKRVVSVSAAKDSQTAKQTKINKKDQGIFTYFFWKILNAKPKCSLKQMEPIINRGMAKFNQHCTFYAAQDEALNAPIFA